ncbi:MAG TPA: transglutaminase domain-containing protein [Candidatus Dormibacteraeota bacterium]|nr:transglutaminase domain-containing protein [Candidatus Dormibacteraeota bacterium]
MKRFAPRARIKIILAVWVLAVFVMILPRPTAAGENFNYDTRVTYHVNTDGSTQVTEHYSVTNNTPRLYLNEITLSTPTATLTNLNVTYDGGGSIPATTNKQKAKEGDIDFDYQQIKIDFPRQIFGQGRSWGFTVRYQATGLVESRGGSHTVYVPSIEPAEGTDDYQVTVEVPTSFGTAHFAGIKSASAGTRNGTQYFNFNKGALMTRALALNFGDTNIYRLNFNFPLHNNGLFPQTLTVALPPDMGNQKTYINSLTPKPSATRLDADGNILADYKLKAGERITVATDVTTEVRWRDYDLSKSGKQKDIPPELISQYTQPTRYWQTGGSVSEAAGKIHKPEATVADNVRNTYRYVIDKLDYNKDKIKFNIRQGATKALAQPDNVVCLEYSDLMVALLRAQGIPARMPVGYAYSGNLKQSDAVDDSLHSWVEAYVPGVGWMVIDPTWGEKFDQFGASDLEHVAFSVWGREDELPAAVMASGRDTNYQYEKTTLSYISSLAEFKPAGLVKFDRYVLFPGITVERFKVTAPPHTSTVDNEVTVDKEKLQFGRLAPGQQESISRLVIGDGWFGEEQASYSQPSGQEVLVLGTAKARYNYTPMAVVTILLLASTIAIIELLRRRRRTLATAHGLPSSNGQDPEI